MQTATAKSFKVGATLISKVGGYEFTITKKYDVGIWEARGQSGCKCLFEGEAKFYNVKPEK